MLRDSRRLDWLRLIGAVVVAVGIFLLVERQQGDWAPFVLFLFAAIPCVALYVIAFATAKPGDALERWQTGLMIAAVALALAALRALAAVFGADDSPGAGATFWVTALVVGATALIAVQYRSPVHTLIAALTGIVSFFALLTWTDADLDYTDVRDILAGFTAVYWIAAYLLLIYRREAGEGHADYLILVGGITGIVSGSIGAGTSASVVGSLLPAVGFEASSRGWEFLLLGVALLSIGYTLWQGYRGSAYVGAIGLFAFLVLNREGGVGGWPLWLTLIGAAMVVVSLFGKEIGAKPGRTGQQPTPPSPPPPSAPPPPSVPPGQ